MNQLVQTFTKSILQGDVHSLLELHSSAIESKMDHLSFYEKVVKPSMYRIGEMWEKNQITVADEHLATATLKYLLSYLMNEHKAGKDQPKAILFCIEGEQHSLGLELANEIFKEQKWNTRFLGANVPIKDAVTFIEAWQPQMVGISIGMTTELGRLKTCIESIRKVNEKINIVVGGRLVAQYKLDFLEKEQVMTFNDLDELNSHLTDLSKQSVSLES
ncbi:cobalamin-dependent protein [Bacillus sp. JRC01]|nr:cobalamin-dependent protein [Bacillus sp. JRC01]